MRTGLLAPLLLALACNDAATDRREWRPSDHDHTDNPSENQVVGGPDGGTAPELARVGLNEVTIMAWQQNCVRCHGRIGRGDGPQGPMTKATDLGNPDFQRTISDEQIMKSVREGKGLMPAFPLPEPTLKSLVQLVRLIGKATAEAAVAAAAQGLTAGSAMPGSSAAPHGSVRSLASAKPAASVTRPVLVPTTRAATSAGAPTPAAPAPAPAPVAPPPTAP